MTSGRKVTMFYVVHSTVAGASSSAGYVSQHRTREGAARKVARLQRDTPATDDGPVVRYTILAPGEHECSIPGWVDACRECAERPVP